MKSTHLRIFYSCIETAFIAQVFCFLSNDPRLETTLSFHLFIWTERLRRGYIIGTMIKALVRGYEPLPLSRPSSEKKKISCEQ
uniref:Ovule protein n=1 Tax=Parascaris univalens TaxID=6257 RepID=A0A915AIJ5_PARUN